MVYVGKGNVEILTLISRASLKHFSSYVNLIISLMSPFNDSCVSVIVHSSSKMATKYNSEILSAVMVWQWQSKVWLYLLTSLLMFSSPMDWHTALYTLVNKVNFSFTFVSTPYIRTTTMSQFFQVIKDICHLGEESLFPPFVLVLLGRFALSKGNYSL